MTLEEKIKEILEMGTLEDGPCGVSHDNLKEALQGVILSERQRILEGLEELGGWTEVVDESTDDNFSVDSLRRKKVVFLDQVKEIINKQQ